MWVSSNKEILFLEVQANATREAAGPSCIKGRGNVMTTGDTLLPPAVLLELQRWFLCLTASVRCGCLTADANLGLIRRPSPKDAQ